MATKKEILVNDVINTTESIKNTSVTKSDIQLTQEQLKTAQGIAKSPRKKFKCNIVYAGYFPDGFISTYQGIPIYLIFDGRTIELPEEVIAYVEERLEEKVRIEAEKLNKFTLKTQEKIGDFTAE